MTKPAAAVFWLPGPWPGRLGIVPRPRGGDWLSDDVAAWRRSGIDVVVSLLEGDEEAQLDLVSEASAVEREEAEFRSFPIPDRGVPASKDAFAMFSAAILEALERGRHVVVHCRQSVGRSGMLAAAVLMSAGLNLSDALMEVRASRGLEVPETPEQRQWLEEFAAWVRTSTQRVRQIRRQA